jgi:hypothetical protein
MSPKTMALATLIALVACDASAQAIGTQERAPNLSGPAGASLARITAYGRNLILTNELGQTTKAWIDWPGVKDEAQAASRRKTLSQYLIKIAKLGGYLARANDPPPGNIVMWRGLSRLTDIGLGAAIGARIVGN